MKRRWAILGLVGWWGLFTFVGWRSLDPDLGWHLRMGEIIEEKGLPATDPFSYTMPNYPFVDHEWLTNLLMAKIYRQTGYKGLAVVFGGLMVGVLVMAVPWDKRFWALIPILLGTGVWVTRAGVRPQILDWLGVAVLLKIMSGSNWERWKWGIPVLFGLWANLHGGFALGPAILLTGLAVKWWGKKKINFSDVRVWLVGVLATGINPYGFRVWWEVWMQMTDSSLRSNIAEWQPFFVRMELGFWLLLSLLVAGWKIVGKEVEKWRWVVLGGLGVGALSSLRHMPLMVVATIGVIAEMLWRVSKKIGRSKLITARAKWFYTILVGVAAVVFAVEIGETVWVTAATKGVKYPVEAVGWLKNNMTSGRLFSNYAWGGFLIWQMPGEKVFIDGRMPSWRWVAPPGESDWAFKDYIKITSEGEFEKLFDKYRISTVLWPKGELVEKSGVFWGEWENWIRRRLFGEKKPKDWISALEKAGWDKKYEDEAAVVYMKGKP